MSEAIFQHVRVSGKGFERLPAVLDSMWYEDCYFKDCELFYSGGPTETRVCWFENIGWRFQGAAVLTIETMQKLGWTVVPPEPEAWN